MNDTAPNPPRRKREVPAPAGEVTRIDVPKPLASAMNPHRPTSELIKAQLLHIQHAESARLPRHKRSGVNLADIHTEAQAAKYIREVTRLLHPQRRKRSARKPAN
jgi:hypothetical protein